MSGPLTAAETAAVGRLNHQIEALSFHLDVLHGLCARVSRCQAGLLTKKLGIIKCSGSAHEVADLGYRIERARWGLGAERVSEPLVAAVLPLVAVEALRWQGEDAIALRERLAAIRPRKSKKRRGRK